MKFAIIVLISVAIIGKSSAFNGYKPFCPPDAGLIYFPHDNDCTKYYTCSFGDLVEVQCPDGLHFNEEFKICDYPEHAGCENPSSTTTGEPDTTVESTTEELTTPACRDSMMTLLPHMSDCTKFYLNIGETPYEVQCDEGKMFDSMLEDCVVMSARGC